jgi:hypothetical protein
MSTLLEQASLVLIPSGYKEDIVYSQIPTSGAGDLSFTRASNGTRVNSAGLVEDVPWNLVTYSNDFLNAAWLKSNINLTSGQTDKDGGTNAWKVDFAGSANSAYMFQELPAVQKTGAVWVKGTAGQTAYIGIRSSVASGALFTFSGSWQQVVETSTDLYFIFSNYGAGTATTFLMQYVQANIGTTLKPYFPTTDRLNVPRLTYQNGGGGCPSLLLEKQSTNLVSYSQDFSNAYWSKLGQGVGSTSVVTANYAISPDGTQNATRFVCNLNGGTTSSDRSWMIASFTAQATSTVSIWIKLNSAGTKTVLLSDSGGGTKTISGTDWQRIDATFVGASGEFRIGLIGGTTSDTLDCCIWGAQAESGSYVTSYIPTTSASATRVADACFKTGISSLIGQTEGTLFAQFNKPIDPLVPFRLNLSDGTTNNWVFIGFEALSFRGYIRASSSVILTNNFSGTANVNKIAIAYKSGDYAIYHNGTQIVTGSSSFTFNGTLNQINVGENPTNDNYAVGQIAEILVSKTRLTNAELASLTTI